MTDGHTKEGAWVVKLELTEDQVQQLIRSMDWAKAMDSHEDKLGYPQEAKEADIQLHRKFIQEILENLYKAVMDQKPPVQ